MCFLRDQSPRSALEVLGAGARYRDLIAGVGLDSAEAAIRPASSPRSSPRRAAPGFAAVAHAGEEGPAAYVAEALDTLRVARVDHGVRAIDDAALVERLASERVTLTMCPLSNLRLAWSARSPSTRSSACSRRACAVTVNSDDPAYFGGYLVDNYLAAGAALGLTRADVVALARNSIAGSLLPAARRAELLAEIDAYAEMAPE